MGKEELVARILSDAEEESRAIIKEAEEKAEKVLSAASARAEELKNAAKKETDEACAAIRDGRQAAARLDAQKILLAEKRRVLDTVYERALASLVALDRAETLALTERLLEEYAQPGDEIVFARNYPCAEEAANLPVVKERGLKIYPVRAELSGGFVLRGEISDTDLSYSALLSEDRERNQAELAAKLFKTK